MALKATRKIAPEWYTPKSERKEEEPTRFKIKPLTPPQLEEVFELDGSCPPRNYSRVLAYGLTDWENFDDPDTGKPLKCSFPNHGRIPNKERGELVGEILELSQMTQADEKNS